MSNFSQFGGGGSATGGVAINRFQTLATNNQSTITVTGGYEINQVDVFINGILIPTTDYVANNGSTIVLNDPLYLDDVVTVNRYALGVNPYNFTIRRTVITDIAGQSTVTVANGYSINNVDVYLNGIKLIRNVDFTATNGTTITLSETIIDSADVIEVVGY